ncbi:MAG: excinuclease ABC subunit UvrC [Sulfurimonas sp.]
MNLEQNIRELPHTFGIYQYFDKNGKLLYIGKAKNLNKRVKSYFSFTPTLAPNPKLNSRIASMISQTTSLNYIVLSSEHDALILENSLIKQLNPKYNILLRDDKTFPYIYIDTSQDFPRFEITRKVIEKKDIKYFGPFSVGANEIIKSIYELCKLVQKKGSLKNKKLCLFYQIGKCLGPCELSVSKESYNLELEKAYEYIKDKNRLIKELEKKMLFYSDELRFEEALELRESIKKIEKSQVKSEIDLASNENYDIFVLKDNGKKAVVLKMFMRGGKIISTTHSIIDISINYDEDEILKRVILNFYESSKPPIVAPILVSCDFADLLLVSSCLSDIFGKKAEILVPQKGSKKELINLGLKNCDELLKQDSKKITLDPLDELKELLKLENIPHRIEVFDNSHISSVANVAAMVVYENGAYDKSSKRLYHLEARDEYSQMREVLTRRIESFNINPPPSLWLLDGGAALLNLALELLHSYGVNLEVVAISKEKIDAKTSRAKGSASDILYTKDEIFKLPPTDKRLHFMQKLRDEAHRSAITFHRQTKLKQDQQSDLLELKGISKAKIKKLLNHFGTFEEIKKATLDELSDILNNKDAQIIRNYCK